MKQENRLRMCRAVTGPQAHQLVPGKSQHIAINHVFNQTTHNLYQLYQGRTNRVSPSYSRTGGGAHWGVSSRNSQNALYGHLHLDDSDPVLTSRCYSLYPT